MSGPPSHSATSERLIQAMGKELKRDPATIQASHKLREDVGLNSLDAIELIFKVEEEFDIAIPDSDLQQLVTVGDLIDYIDSRLNGGPAPKTAAAPAAAKPAAAAKPPAAARPSAPASPKGKTVKKTASTKGRRGHA